MKNIKKEQFYSEEEKQLFIDHFLLKGDEVKKQFRDYLENFIKTNGVEVAENLKKPSAYKGSEPINQLQRNNWAYDSHHMLWDKYSRDNVLTHILPTFIPDTNSALSHNGYLHFFETLTNINKLHPNWNHKNKEGNTALHIIANKGQLYLANKLIEDFDINIDIKNKNGDYYTFMYLKPEAHHQNRVIRVDLIKQVFEQNAHHFDNISMDKLIELKGNVEILKEIDLKNRQNTIENKGLTLEQKIEQTQKHFSQIDTFLENYYLKKIQAMNEKNEKGNEEIKVVKQKM